MDVREILRHLQTTTNLSAIQRATGLNRRTLMRYRAWATEQGLLAGPLPAAGRAAAARGADADPAGPAADRLDGRALPRRWCSTSTRAGWRGRRSGSGCASAATPAASPRSIGSSTRSARRPRTVTVRVERGPGTEAQVDFGYAGYLLDDATGQRAQGLGLRHDAGLQPPSICGVRLRPGAADLDCAPPPRLCLLRRHPPARRAG